MSHQLEVPYLIVTPTKGDYFHLVIGSSTPRSHCDACWTPAHQHAYYCWDRIEERRLWKEQRELEETQTIIAADCEPPETDQKKNTLGRKAKALRKTVSQVFRK